ncbi:MAG: hypothetical protein WC653_05365 [Candidatus Gracilibacteria bacterium]
MNQEESDRHPVARIVMLVLLVFVMIFVASFGLEYLIHQMKPKPVIAESPPVVSKAEPPVVSKAEPLR